jgi:hypothetical protein
MHRSCFGHDSYPGITPGNRLQLTLCSKTVRLRFDRCALVCECAVDLLRTLFAMIDFAPSQCRVHAEASFVPHPRAVSQNTAASVSAAAQSGLMASNRR